MGKPVNSHQAKGAYIAIGELFFIVTTPDGHDDIPLVKLGYDDAVLATLQYSALVLAIEELGQAMALIHHQADN